jgi:hypothetical protein
MISRFGPRRCKVCRGKECHGGGNLKCAQRDPKPSVLTGILDTYGGLRFVVTQRENLKHHVRPDEFAIIVPDLTVHEPIAWGHIPYVVARIELVVDQLIAQGRIPNEPHALEAVTMYQLRKLEHRSGKRSFNPDVIAYT